jgi:UDP-2,3-diacylglucosamine hydrolase
LADLKDSGCEVKLIEGNHDFAYGNFFRSELGIETLKNAVAELHGRRVYICHGDGMPKRDGSYRLFRKILDFKPNRLLFKLLHPDIGMRLALSVGSNSREANKKRMAPEEEYLEKARALMRENGCDTFAHGHNHQRGLWKVPEGVVINCGNWLFEEDYACIFEKKCYVYKNGSLFASS